MPMFAPLREIGEPVTMDGKDWAPMNSFGDLSWDEIKAVCAATNGGHCLAGGPIDGVRHDGLDIHCCGCRGAGPPC